MDERLREPWRFIRMLFSLEPGAKDVLGWARSAALISGRMQTWSRSPAPVTLEDRRMMSRGGPKFVHRLRFRTEAWLLVVWCTTCKPPHYVARPEMQYVRLDACITDRNVIADVIPKGCDNLHCWIAQDIRKSKLKHKPYCLRTIFNVENSIIKEQKRAAATGH